MKLYKILKSFRGSQTGAEVEDFEEGTECLLSDDLAKCVEDDVKLVKAKKAKQKADAES